MIVEANQKFHLSVHGDAEERKYWGLFIAREFPAYGVFWERNVAPTTKRYKSSMDIRAMDDDELAEIGKCKWDVLVNQLHYSVLAHLIGAYDIMNGVVNKYSVVACFGRLCGAIDVADELIERWIDVPNRAAHTWDRREGEHMRNQRKNQRPEMLKQVMYYRNALMHGQVMPGVYSQRGHEWMPNLDEKIWRRYQDWRTVTNGRGITEYELNANFTQQKELLEQAWRTVIKYLEKSWRTHLLT